MEQSIQQNQFQIKAGDSEIKGVYANVMQVQHSKEEFCLDFLNIFPPLGVLTARIIISPGHLKRMIKVLDNVLTKYEKEFGSIGEAQEPPKPEVGFVMK
ncbi:MAG: DUF3467 domain-containing protein [Patescibacteria group bacterium]|nr:DUF3467 domain-containing protein [Patescibacteria group bacterium]